MAKTREEIRMGKIFSRYIRETSKQNSSTTPSMIHIIPTIREMNLQLILDIGYERSFLMAN
ncbi:hypothetical protein [Porphyromonas macacae]|uniref:hypothetical protein n=1 Tax=Porphyromonas macacae TaxID=28115 RepID=UPI001F593829|nr:hypothetical protein [Porphyromonas macacae]